MFNVAKSVSSAKKVASSARTLISAKDVSDFQVGRFKPSAGLLSNDAIEQLRGVISKDPEDRTDADLLEIENIVLVLKFFKNAPSKMRHYILKIAKFVKYDGDTCVFSQGDPGRFFYIILRGKVEVVIREPYSGREIRVAFLFSGQEFGELALHKATGKRNATINTVESTEFIIIDRENYTKSVKHWEENRMQNRCRFLKEVYFLNHWNYTNLKELTKYFISKSCSPNEVIIAEGELSDDMYIIAKGNCRLLKIAHYNGCRIMLDIGELGPKDFFGEATMSTNEPRRCSVVACGNVELLVLNRYDFLKRVMMDERTVTALRAFGDEYYKSEKYLLHMFEKCYLWDQYKETLVEGARRPNPIVSDEKAPKNVKAQKKTEKHYTKLTGKTAVERTVQDSVHKNRARRRASLSMGGGAPSASAEAMALLEVRREESRRKLKIVTSKEGKGRIRQLPKLGRRRGSIILDFNPEANADSTYSPPKSDKVRRLFLEKVNGDIEECEKRIRSASMEELEPSKPQESTRSYKLDSPRKKRMIS